MNGNILLSKLVAIPTDVTWSQAYSTLNLYIVLSIQSETPAKGIVVAGKELFERIQREYFSLDEKNLKNIKKAVENAVEPIVDKNSISVVLATISENILYIVTAGEAEVILKRNDKIGTIAKGAPGEIAAFSGNLEGSDIVILETADFGTKIPVAKLSTLMDHLEVSEISENIAPIVHENPKGTEAAILLQYKDMSPISSSEPRMGDEEEVEKTETVNEKEKESVEEEAREPEINAREDAGTFLDDSHKEEPEEQPTINQTQKSSRSFNFGFAKKKNLILIIIVVLIVALAGSVFYERSSSETKKREAVLNEIITPAQKRFDEAEALISLNKGLALDEFNQIKTDLTGSQNKIKQGTPERKKLDEFIGRVEQKIGELGAGSTLSGQEVIFDNADLVQFKDDQLAVVTSDGAVNLLDSDGKSTEDFDTENTGVLAIAENETTVFILGGDGITQSTKTGSTKTAVDDAAGTVALDTFGANLYGLNTADKTIDKYAGSAFTKSNYLKDVTLSDPTSFAIDSSVWVLDAGKVRKFTKGAEDTFSVSGLNKDLSSDAQIFTSVDYKNIYILDAAATRIISISKDGEVKNQYVSKELGQTNSFAVDEEGKKIYVTISGKLSSFDL